MFKNLNIRKKLLIYLTVVYSIFTLLILVFQYEREKDYKQEQLENTLDNINVLTNKYIKSKRFLKTGNFYLLDSIKNIIPRENIRITIISPKGKVWYDSECSNIENMENHLHRPEIQKAIGNNFGSNIRESETTTKEYYYYAKFYSDYFIRTAAEYNIEIKNFLHVEKLFIIYLLILFIISSIVIILITKKLGETFTKLKNFAIKVSSGKTINKNISFPNDELGVI
ncbi:MAG: two-component sensor histidine kinase, partial [Bacteroidota bacterium]|nr:two-component sensor histidine kinase [Bacteroidota bacterium]